MANDKLTKGGIIGLFIVIAAYFGYDITTHCPPCPCNEDSQISVEADTLNVEADTLQIDTLGN